MGYENGVDNSNDQAKNPNEKFKIALPIAPTKPSNTSAISNETKIHLKTQVNKDGNNLGVYMVFYNKNPKYPSRNVYLLTEEDEPIGNMHYYIEKDHINVTLITRYADYANLDQALLEFLWTESLNEKRYGLPKVLVHNYPEMLFYYQLGFRVASKDDKYFLWGSRFESSLNSLITRYGYKKTEKNLNAILNLEVDGVSYKNTLVPFVRNKLNLANDDAVTLEMVLEHGLEGSCNDALAEGIDFSQHMKLLDKHKMSASFEMYVSIETCTLPCLDFSTTKESDNSNSNQNHSENLGELESLKIINKKLQEDLQQQQAEFNQQLAQLKQVNLDNHKDENVEHDLQSALQKSIEDLQKQLAAKEEQQKNLNNRFLDLEKRASVLTSQAAASKGVIESHVLYGKELAGKLADEQEKSKKLERERDDAQTALFGAKQEAEKAKSSESDANRQFLGLQEQKNAEDMLRVNVAKCIDRLNDYVTKYSMHSKRETTFWHKHSEKGRVRANEHYSKWQLAQYKELTELLNNKFKERLGQPYDANAMRTIFNEVLQQLHDNALSELKSLKGGNWHKHSYRTSGLMAYSKDIKALKEDPNALAKDFSLTFGVLKEVDEAEVKSVRQSLHL